MGDKMNYALSVRNLSFAYGRNKVLRKISLDVPEGKITTVLGANGCGKSTLFSLITRSLVPSRGKILINGKNIWRLSLNEFARNVSIVHQYNSAADDLTVSRLVSFGRTPYQKMFGGKSREDEEKTDWAIRVTGLESFRDREISRLSGGQRQRAWIAMALAQNTRILLLDEPTTYLDIRYQIEILELIRKINREYGITILMVLHDINQAIHFSDTCIGLKDGNVIMDGPPENVINEEIIHRLYGIKLKITEAYGEKVVLTF